MHILWAVLLACALSLIAVGSLGLYCTAHGAWFMVLALGSAGVAMVALGRTPARKDRSMVTIAPCKRSSLVLAMLVLAAILSTRWVRLNISPSLPLGLYYLTTVPSPLPVGTLVLLPVPASMRPWWSWVPVRLLKPVAAVSGDEVCVEHGWLRVANDWVGPVLQEAKGKVLPHLTGCQVVPDGEVFLASDAPNSMDSRYFGSVPIATLTAQAHPLLTWHNAGR